MVYVDASDLDASATYRLLAGSVVPRPIAWVTSGTPPKPINLAPFSAFTWVHQYPALLGFFVHRRSHGPKDTITNIENDGAYVVNIADESLLDAVHASSEWLPPGVSEAEALGLELIASTKVATPRLAAAPISMECVFERTVAFRPHGGEFVVGEVVAWHIDDAVLEGTHIASHRLKPVGRLGGQRYSLLGRDLIELPPVPDG